MGRPVINVLLTILLCFPYTLFAGSDVLQSVRPVARGTPLPPLRWHDVPGAAVWERRAVQALRGHAQDLTDFVPADIEGWCPGYTGGDAADRRAFWIGLLSVLSRYESTWRPEAVGGGGRWFGLTQIAPATARGYGCKARSGRALQDGGANLACALRIWSVTVPRDGVIHGRDRKWRGISADWGPMRSQTKRTEMRRWLRRQPFCQSRTVARPVLRPLR